MNMIRVVKTISFILFCYRPGVGNIVQPAPVALYTLVDRYVRNDKHVMFMIHGLT